MGRQILIEAHAGEMNLGPLTFQFSSDRAITHYNHSEIRLFFTSFFPSLEDEWNIFFCCNTPHVESNRTIGRRTPRGPERIAASTGRKQFGIGTAPQLLQALQSRVFESGDEVLIRDGGCGAEVMKPAEVAKH